MSDTPCLQLDVGNSSAKWRLVQAGQVLARGCYVADDANSLRELQAVSPAPAQIWISSVASAAAEKALSEILQAQWQIEPWFARTALQTLDLVNSYEDPARMGVDRWLAMLGARQRCKKRLCVVDVGSALTIDIVAGGGSHEGGYIIPGPHLMERALLLDTDRVRFDEDIDYSLSPGISTAEAVRHGIAIAQAGAVRLALEQAADPLPQLFVCGGGGDWLSDALGGEGENAPDLVFDGLEVMAQQVL
jgi:type III pantothenate kinase